MWTEPLVTQRMLLRSQYQQLSRCCFPDLEMLKEKCFHPLEVVKGAEKYVVLLFSHPWRSDKYTERFQRQNLSSIQETAGRLLGESTHVTMQYPPISSQKLKFYCKRQSNNTSGKYWLFCSCFLSVSYHKTHLKRQHSITPGPSFTQKEISTIWLLLLDPDLASLKPSCASLSYSLPKRECQTIVFLHLYIFSTTYTTLIKFLHVL